MSNQSKTRADIPMPARKMQSTFLPAKPVAPADNMSGERLAPMTFNMPQDWHRRFKMTAALRGISMKDLLVECFAAWERDQRDKDLAE